MDLLKGYADEDEDMKPSEEESSDPSNPSGHGGAAAAAAEAPSSPESGSSSSPPRLSLGSKSSAPSVDETALALTAAGSARSAHRPLDPTQHAVGFNPTYDQLWAPVLGPAHPFAKDGLAQGLRNHKLGFVEDAAIQPFLFDEQYNTFHKFGYATDPSGLSVVGDLDTLAANAALSVYNLPPQEQKRRRLHLKSRDHDADADAGAGAGASSADAENPATDDWLLKNRKSPWSGKKEAVQGELTEDQRKYAEAHAQKKAEKEGRGEGGRGDKPELVVKSTFHGKEERDYQGRSWIAPPKDAKATNDHCYIPKRLVHTWSGHTKGVSAIRFFPKHGHLLLSASMDSKVKIWDVFNSGKCMRTYMGHSKAVRDISFSNDGSKFLSAGYDKNIQYWDTETGQVISTFSTGKIPYVVKLNPDEDKQNILLAGMSDKKIVQWDMNSGQITQEYDQHLGAVNTITFVDNNRRFVTSSDDKSLRVWEFGIPVVIKYISEPHMHSMPSISLHPNSNWLAAQSLDNQILIYSTKERFQLNKKKRFAGHIAAGYACQVNFSPDGRFVISGDGEGKCWFWDWKSCKVFRTLKCHDGVCIGCEWHPLEQSKVATCGWDGMIKYW
ncbi:pre-mRNA-processing factor 17 [Ananas comosus]|uniref:Pre-mRNA-processing factor 17 n=1 Tax=Ananas comosus TaxID=4615 RepID=A0A6P5GHT6_ANACO|nr:pre-mRNA-processing factor 17 [Ananas comosus]